MGGDGLDELIHQSARLRIMALLYEHRRVRYTVLRDGLQLTSGNLTAHLRRLSHAQYVQAHDSLASGVFELVYTITPVGSDAFRAYIATLRNLLPPDGPNG